MSDLIPGRGRYTEAARAERLDWLRKRTGAALPTVGATGFDAGALTGNVENFAGSVEVPVGLAGPLLFTGGAVDGSVVAPIATTEGALVASASRGARAITACGGVRTRVLRQRMTRAPSFEFADLDGARLFTTWLRDHRGELQEQVTRVSRHTRLIDVDPHQIGRHLHVRFVFETDDAAGQNMTTAATWQICRWILETLTHDDTARPVHTMLEGNLSSDKKVSAVSMLAGRGLRVTAECTLSREVLASVLKTTPEGLLKGHSTGLLGAQLAGMSGYGVNAANIVAGLFLATGQDVACVHESGLSIVSVEPQGDGLVATILLPNLVSGTVGGGTALPHQREWLTAMGCAGTGGSARFAEIVAGFALALDVSTMSAVASGQFADAHRRLGRARKVDWLQTADLDAAVIRRLFTDRLGDPGIRVESVRTGPRLAGDGISSELGALGERRKQTGLHPMSVTWAPGNGVMRTTELIAKIKPTADEVIAGIGMMASLCGHEVAAAWERWGPSSEFAGSHHREVAVQRRTEPALVDLLPRCHGVLADDNREAYVILMERLNGTDPAWSRDRIDDALRAIGRVHGTWLGHDQELFANGWLHRTAGPSHLVKARELWEALARHNAREVPDLIDARRLAVVLDIARDAGFWSQELEALPRTLVHNDFNPRNIAVEDGRIVVYDWELATVNVPQRDVADLLVFTLGPDSTATDVEHHLRVHRDAVAAVSPEAARLSAAADWRHGYRLALREVLLSRLTLYTAAHTQRELTFLPKALDTAFHLWDLESE